MRVGECTPVEKDITDFWARLCPVAGYTSGWLRDLSRVFVPTKEAVAQAHERAAALSSRAQAELDDRDLRETAVKQLRLLTAQLDFPQPGAAVSDCGDGAFYIGLLKGAGSPPGAWLRDFLTGAGKKIAFEADRLRNTALDVVHKKQCLDAADYCAQTMRILQEQVPREFDEEFAEVLCRTAEFRELFQVQDLDSRDFATMFRALKAGSMTPFRTGGYPQLLARLYDFTPSASDLDLTARSWLAQDMPIVRELAAELGSLLGLGPDATVADVWDAVGSKWPVPGDNQKELPEFVRKAADICNNFAKERLIDVGTDTFARLKLLETPDYMQPVITGGQDIAVRYLTSDPQSCLYLTPGKVTALPTLLNIMVHEFSHGLNFVLAAQYGRSPLLNFAGPMQVPLTEGQAFWREWEYWHAAAELHGRDDLSATERDYLELYGSTPLEQAQCIRAAQFETYIWRVVRYLRAMCDVQVNMGWRTLPGFLEWAAEETGLTVEFLYGECFTFLAQPGYAPAYGIDGIAYGELQKAAIARDGTPKPFNTKASAMGFYPWTVCTRRLSKM
ncbi:hypothetical protein ACWD4B_19225 [Streptomyces sp. NPDC002536]